MADPQDGKQSQPTTPQSGEQSEIGQQLKTRHDPSLNRNQSQGAAGDDEETGQRKVS